MGDGEGGGDGDSDDEENLKDEGPTFGKDGRPQGPTQVYEAVDAAAFKGSEVDLQGIGVYQTGIPGPSGVLLVSDLYGWRSGRVRHVADYLGAALNAFVVVPRLLDTPCLAGGTEGDGLPPDFDTRERKAEMRPWVMKYLWETFKPKIEATAVHMRNNGVKRIGGVGFGFGAWATCKASEVISEFVCNACVYPMVHMMEDLMDGNPHRLFQRMRVPQMFMAAGDDPGLYKEEGDFTQIIMNRFPADSECLPYHDMLHDWVVRGDISDADVKDAAQNAATGVAKFLRKFLWPPPTGANAATLRLMCQDGNGNLVRELLAAGVPAGGKDAVDIIGLAPMHYAAKAEHSWQAVRCLVDFEADIDAPGGVGRERPLHIAAGLSRAKAVKALLQGKADVNGLDKAGQTALHHAAREGSVPTCKELLRAKADLGAKDAPSGQTPMHLAAWYGREGVCVLMMKVKADIDAEDLRSQTAQKRSLQHGFEALHNVFVAERQRREEAKKLAEEEDVAKAST